MKSVIYALLALAGASTLFAGDVAIRCFPVNSSFPYPELVLNQELPKREGKETRVPYMLSSVLPEEFVLKYAEATDPALATSKSSATLPNGGVAEVTILNEKTSDGITQFESKIQIKGPGANNLETSHTTNNGDGILIRCDTKGKGDPQLIFLQIKKS